MKTSAAVLVAVATFALGAAVGRTLTDDAPAPSPSVPPSAAPRAAGPDAAPAPPTRTRGAGAGASPVKLDAAAERAAAAASRATFDLPPLVGDGAIRGVVKSDAGAPVEGVEVRAYAYTPPEWNEEVKGLRWDEVPLDESARRFVRDRRWWEASKKSATTAADGSYALRGLADVNWSVSAVAEGYSLDAKQNADPARVGSVVDFVATSSVRLDFDVRLPDGTRPTRVRLRFATDDADRWTEESWWPGRTDLSMKPGRYRLTAMGGDDGRFAAAPLDLDVKRGIAPVVVTLRPRPGIVVVAKRPEGFAELDVRFVVVPADGPEPSDDELRGPTNKARRLDEEGGGDRRAFRDVAPGRWLVAAGLDGAPLARRTLDVGDAVVDCELTLPAPDLSQFVELHASGPDGAPVAEAQIGWEYRAERESGSYSTTSLARGPGVWLVRRVGPGDRPRSSSRSGDKDAGGRWFLAARASAFGEEQVEVVAGASRADVRFRPPARAVVRVTGLPRGADPRRFTAMISRSSGSANLVGAPLGADGKIKLTPVAPGPHEIRLDLAVGEWSKVTIERRTVELAAGEDPVEFSLPPLHALDVDLGAQAANDSCGLYLLGDGDDDRWIRVELDAAGRAKLDLVPAGRYRIRVGDKDHEFSVPETRVLKL